MALKTLSYALALAAVLAASGARADILYSRSPINGAFKFKLGNYNPGPSIDSEPGLSGSPYNTIFGGKSLLLFEMSYDYYIWNKLGTAGASLSVGYGEKYAAAPLADDPTQFTQEKTGLRLAPIKLMALYNFDYGAREHDIPLVPYARAGLAWMPWWVMKGGDVAYVDGQRFAGAKWGLAGTLGIAFLLDVLEPRMASDMDTSVGINHSYLFAEFNITRADNFGAGGLNLSANNWMFGLALEF